jgi:hypothetical protein
MIFSFLLCLYRVLYQRNIGSQNEFINVSSLSILWDCLRSTVVSYCLKLFCNAGLEVMNFFSLYAYVKRPLFPLQL